METHPLSESQLRDILNRCPEDTIEAALRYRVRPNNADATNIVQGILERFVEPQVRPLIREAKSEIRLIEDLMIDSLLMIEIVVVIEDIFQIEIPNEDLRNICRLGDLNAYLEERHTDRMKTALAS